MTSTGARIVEIANAVTSAAKIAATLRDPTDHGLEPISNPLAVYALTRALAEVIRYGGEPVVWRISDAEARAFPRNVGGFPDGAVHYLGAAFDVAGRPTFAIRSAWDEDVSVASGIAREAVWADLFRACSTSGFPTPEATGTSL